MASLLSLDLHEKASNLKIMDKNPKFVTLTHKIICVILKSHNLTKKSEIWRDKMKVTYEQPQMCVETFERYDVVTLSEGNGEEIFDFDDLLNNGNNGKSRGDF